MIFFYTQGIGIFSGGMCCYGLRLCKVMLIILISSAGAMAVAEEVNYPDIWVRDSELPRGTVGSFQGAYYLKEEATGSGHDDVVLHFMNDGSDSNGDEEHSYYYFFSSRLEQGAESLPLFDNATRLSVTNMHDFIHTNKINDSNSLDGMWDKVIDVYSDFFYAMLGLSDYQGIFYFPKEGENPSVDNSMFLLEARDYPSIEISVPFNSSYYDAQYESLSRIRIRANDYLVPLQDKTFLLIGGDGNSILRMPEDASIPPPLADKLAWISLRDLFQSYEYMRFDRSAFFKYYFRWGYEEYEENAVYIENRTEERWLSRAMRARWKDKSDDIRRYPQILETEYIKNYLEYMERGHPCAYLTSKVDNGAMRRNGIAAHGKGGYAVVKEYREYGEESKKYGDYRAERDNNYTKECHDNILMAYVKTGWRYSENCINELRSSREKRSRFFFASPQQTVILDLGLDGIECDYYYDNIDALVKFKQDVEKIIQQQLTGG